MADSLPTQSSAQRHVVVLSRHEYEVDDDAFGARYEQVVIGPFRSLERAVAVAARIRRLADTYDDPEGEPKVTVEPIRRGATSASDALDYLYGGRS